MDFAGGEWAICGIGIAIIIIYIICEIIDDVSGCIAFLAVMTGICFVASSLSMGHSRADTLSAMRNLQQQGFSVFAANTSNKTAVVQSGDGSCITQVRMAKRDGVWFVVIDKHYALPPQVTCPSR